MCYLFRPNQLELGRSPTILQNGSFLAPRFSSASNILLESVEILPFDHYEIH